jgi:hypothetical protein
MPPAHGERAASPQVDEREPPSENREVRVPYGVVVTRESDAGALAHVDVRDEAGEGVGEESRAPSVARAWRHRSGAPSSRGCPCFAEPREAIEKSPLVVRCRPMSTCASPKPGRVRPSIPLRGRPSVPAVEGLVVLRALALAPAPGLHGHDRADHCDEAENHDPPERDPTSHGNPWSAMQGRVLRRDVHVQMRSTTCTPRSDRTRRDAPPSIPTGLLPWVGIYAAGRVEDSGSCPVGVPGHGPRSPRRTPPLTRERAAKAHR